MDAERRMLLQAVAALAAWSASGSANAAASTAPTDASLAAFLALSATLTGKPIDDKLSAAKVLGVFDTPARRASLLALARLVATTPPADLDTALKSRKLYGLANEIVSTWFSGVTGTGTSQRLVLYLNALVWDAMTFTKPMGVCGGPTGYWADPPR
jgi:hypothetical protein